MALMKDRLFGLTRYFLVITFCISQLLGSSQDLTAEDLQQLQESLLIQTNGSLLIPGEPMLVALRCLDQNGNASQISQVAYVELINEEKNSVLKAVVELQEGIGSASIYLPSYLKTGNYVLIAYTAWMKNYPREFIRQQRLSLVNPYNPIPEKFFLKENKEELTVQVFPTSGGVVWNQDNQIAYQILTTDGKLSGKVQCQIANKQGEVITSFNTDNGSGFFNFTPAKNEDYRFIIVDASNQVTFHPISFSVESEESFKVEKNGSNYSFDANTGSSFALSRNGYIMESLGKSNNSTISQEKLKSGINWIVATSDRGILSRTPLFRKVSRKPATVSLNSSTYKPRSEVKLSIELPENSNDIGYTISVQKKSPVNANASLAHQYFAEGWDLELDKDIALSSLLSKRYSSTSLVSNDLKPTYLPELRSQILSGKVVGERPTNKDIAVSFPSAGSKFVPGRTDDSGQFYLQMDPTDYNGELIFYVQDGNTETYVEMEDTFLGNYDFVVLGDFKLSEKDKNWIVERSVAIQIENAYYGTGESKSIQALMKSDFLSKDGFKSYDLDDFTRFPTVEDAVREFVAEAWLRQTAQGAMFTMPYSENKSGNIDTVLTLLNGIPIDPDYILKLNPLTIDKVDLYQRQLKIGAWEYRGIINFQLYEFDSDQNPLPPNYKSVVTNLVAPYFNPTNQISHTERIPDFRSQLYWNPNYQSTGNKEELVFFASDQEGIFEVTVSGVVDNESFILEKRSFEVRSENF